MPKTRPRTAVSIRVEQLRHGGGLDGLPFGILAFPLMVLHWLVANWCSVVFANWFAPVPIKPPTLMRAELIQNLFSEVQYAKVLLPVGSFLIVGLVLKSILQVIYNWRQRVGTPVHIKEKQSIPLGLKLSAFGGARRFKTSLLAAIVLLVVAAILYEPHPDLQQLYWRCSSRTTVPSCASGCISIRAELHRQTTVWSARSVTIRFRRTGVQATNAPSVAHSGRSHGRFDLERAGHGCL